MKLVGDLKEQVGRAGNKEDARDLIKKAGMLLTDDELDQVAGGSTDSGPSTVTRVEDGVCPNCQRTKYRVTVTQHTENGPWEHTYYECDVCGPL